ncbi:MAG TPA: formyltransferase family protein, partial [Candidatus Cryosericum sp.]
MALDAPRIAVFGSSSISVPVFDTIRCRFHVVLAVVSEEPRIRRGKLLPNPVQAWAQSHSIPVLNGAETPGEVLTQRLVDDAVDILFLLSYGRLLPQTLLDAPRIASINLHPSPLPWYRGAAPIERQIMDGRTQSAVSIIRM